MAERRAGWGLFFGVLAGPGWVSLAGAQGTAPSQADASAGEPVLEEVVVTAEKRLSSAQSTPIAMTVVTGADLDKAGVSDLRAIDAIAPDVNIVRNTLFTQFNIRGVASQDIGELGDSAITVGIDGEYINRPVALNAALMDIERIEVLRGPQGTLYGRNATAGAINIITNKPKNQFEASLSGDAGNYSALGFQGMLNVPLSDTVAVRGAFMTAKHDGYQGYLVTRPDDKGDDQDVWGGRLSLGFTPSDAFSALLAFEYNKVDQAATSQYGVGVSAADVDASGSPSNFKPNLPDDFPLGNIGSMQSEQWAARAHLTYSFGGGVELNYVGGYRSVDVHNVQPLNGFVPELFTFDNDKVNSRTQSHELRLSGGEAAGFLWQAGLFYSDETQDVGRGLYLVPAGNAYINYFLLDVASKSKAAFAQVTGHFTADLTYTLGVRQTQDDKDRNGLTFGFGSGVFPNARPTLSTPGGTADPGHGSWNKTTWTAGLDWHLAADKLLYGKVASGYKAGGFDNVGEYKPENLIDYEIGSKNRFLDGRLQLNLAAFYYDYRDLQTSVFISSAVGSAVQNAGTAKVKGFETDLQYLVSQNDRLHVSLNLLDATFDSLATVQNTLGNPMPVVLRGNDLIQSPKVTAVLGYDHIWRVGPGSLTGSISSRYKSRYSLTVFGWASDEQEAHTISDASLSYSGADDKWAVSAYIRNIENERVLTYAAFTGGGINIYNYIYGTPRTYGANVSYRW